MNDNYKNLEDINMSFKLWNNSYYHVRFKNIEDIKNKKKECLKKSKKYGYIFNILLALFVGLTIYLAILSIYSLSSGNQIGADFVLVFFIGIGPMLFFITLVKGISDNLSNKYNDILDTVEEFNFFSKNINYDKDLLITDVFNILGFDKFSNSFMETDIFYDDIRYVYENDIKLLGTLNKETDKYEVILYLPMGYKEVDMRGITYDND